MRKECKNKGKRWKKRLCENNDDVIENSFLYYVLVCRRLPQVIDDIALIR